MSTFEVQVRRINAIEPHRNADTLEFVVVDDYRAIVRKASHQVGDLVVYIPEAAVTSPFVLKTVGLWDDANQKGRCAGDDGMRVKAVKLRGSISQGLVLPLQRQQASNDTQWLLPLESGATVPVTENEEVGHLLGIEKFRPEIPADLDGLVFDAGIEVMPKFDVEDIKKYPLVLQEGELVSMTEKLHGTFGVFILMPEGHAYDTHGDFIVSSKGLSDKGLAFQNVAENAHNAYVRAASEIGLSGRLRALRARLADLGHDVSSPVMVFGEVIGAASEQDLKYGQSLALAVFDVALGWRSTLSFFDPDDTVKLASSVGLGVAPEIYRGPFSREALLVATNGRETYSGEGLHIREGVVIRPLKGRRDPDLGRVLLKSVSENYLVRGGNATEFS